MLYGIKQSWKSFNSMEIHIIIYEFELKTGQFKNEKKKE